MCVCVHTASQVPLSAFFSFSALTVLCGKDRKGVGGCLPLPITYSMGKRRQILLQGKVMRKAHLEKPPGRPHCLQPGSLLFRGALEKIPTTFYRKALPLFCLALSQQGCSEAKSAPTPMAEFADTRTLAQKELPNHLAAEGRHRVARGHRQGLCCGGAVRPWLGVSPCQCSSWPRRKGGRA